MSDHLLYFFFLDDRLRLDEAAKGDQPKLLWKVVLRTGTWKLRPGPGGVKLKEPLKIYRDKAPKGHISMASLVKNFDAGAKENVTTVGIHADGTISDNGFVRKLVIQDVAGEDGSGVKESLLWAGMEITEPDILGKIERKTLVGCSGGILFDYQETENATKYDQILSHVMITNSPWIGGTGGYTDKLPDGVMASEPDDLPFGELELESDEIPVSPDAPGVALAPETDPTKKPQPTSGSVVWSTTDGFAWIKGKLSRALEDRRRALMAQIGRDEYYKLDYPYYSVDDVQGNGASGKTLICSGYGAEKESWVANYLFEDGDDGHPVAVIEAFQNWTPAKPEWVAASELPPAPSAAPAPTPRGRGGNPSDESELRRAQRLREERLGLSRTAVTTTQGGPRMGRLADLMNGVELSDAQRQKLTEHDEELTELERLRAGDAQRKEADRKSATDAFLATLKDTPFDHPGTLKYIQNLLLSDDGGPAVEYVELSESGQQTQPKPMTATQIIEGFFDTLPKDDKGKLTLSAQAQRLPDDPKPPDDPNEGDKRNPKDKADALLGEFAGQGIELSGVAAPSSGGES